MLTQLFVPVDASFLVLFRIVFSAALLWTVWEYFAQDSIAYDLVRPPFHFTYYGFSWVHPWPGPGMYLHFFALAILALFVGVGFLYRPSVILLFLGFTYVFLLEKSLYLNHYYLICLLCLVMSFQPANCCFAVDAWLRPAIRSDTVPAWTLWLLRFQIALPYILGGVAKLKADWLLGQPMYSWLPISPLRFLIGPIVEQHWMAVSFSWLGALVDLGIVPLLLWPRTRIAAFCVATVFHLLNAFLFNIGVFPWLMIGATLVFFPPDFSRRLLGSTSSVANDDRSPSAALTQRQKFISAALLLYVVVSLLIPFRHLLYPGNVLWTEEGQLFAWNMMLRTKVTGVQFLAIDPSTIKLEDVDVMQWLTPRQFDEMSHDPEMMREFAAFVRDQYRERGQDNILIHVVALSSLNGRKPQLLVDPTIDLSREPRTLWHKEWIMPLVEPFRQEPWDVPRAEWYNYVDLPPIEPAGQPSHSK